MNAKKLKEPLDKAEILKLREIEALELNARAALANASDNAVFTQSLAALYCGLSEHSIMKEAGQMNIIATKKSKFWYFVKKDLDAWLLN